MASALYGHSASASLSNGPVFSLFGTLRTIARDDGLEVLVNRMVWHVVWSVAGQVLGPAAMKRFRARAEGAKDSGAAVDLVMSFKFLGAKIPALQVKEEIAGFMDWVRPRSPKVVLEIGTARGGTLFLLTRCSAPDARIVTVDYPQGPFGGGYPGYMAPFLRAIGRDSQSIGLVSGDSHAPRTLDEVKCLLGGRAVDLLFIDGDHSYDGVKKDFEMYSPLVRRGGLVAFHDIRPGPERRVGGVPVFWKEVSARLEHTIFVTPAENVGCGIGALVMPE